MKQEEDDEAADVEVMLRLREPVRTKFGYYFHQVDPSPPRAIVTKRTKQIYCPFCNETALGNLENLWSHMHETHPDMKYSAMRSRKGRIHLAAKKKVVPKSVFKSSVFNPKATQCVLIDGDTNSGGSGSEKSPDPDEVVARNSKHPTLQKTLETTLWPLRSGYRRMDNYDLINIGEWMLDINPEDEIDNTWRERLDQEYLDEFSDVTSQEKRLMKLWNGFMKSCQLTSHVSRSDIPKVTLAFIEQQHATLQEEGLYLELMKMLVTLRIQNICNRDHLVECANLYDKLCAEEE